MSRYAIHAAAIGFGSGVLAHAAFADVYTGVLLFVTLAVALCVYACMSEAGRIRGALFLCVFALIAAGLGIIRMDAASVSRAAPVDAIIGDYVTARGVVVKEPDTRIETTHLTIALDTISDKTVTRNTRIRAFVSPQTDVAYGDAVTVQGIISLPENFETDTGRTFEYVDYLKRDGVAYISYYPTVTATSHGHGNAVIAQLLAVKNAFLETVYALIPSPESALLAGLVLGEKQALGDDLSEAFRETGVIHVVVLSGYNVTLVADAIMKLVGFLAPVWSATAGGIAIVGFALMTGASATVVRASIMAILVLIARAIGKPYAILNALLLAGILMVAHNPYVLAFDPAFQLSFLATIGLVYVSPFVERWLQWVPGTLQLRYIAAATIATQLFVLPALIYIVGEMSLIAPLANVLVLVAVPAAMLTGFIAGVLGLASAIIAFPIAYVAYALLAYQLDVVTLLADVPGGAITVPQVPLWVVFGVYVALGVWLVRAYRSGKATPRVPE